MKVTRELTIVNRTTDVNRSAKVEYIHEKEAGNITSKWHHIPLQNCEEVMLSLSYTVFSFMLKRDIIESS